LKRAILLSLIFLSALTAIGITADLKLPPNLELISQDSISVVLKNIDTGGIKRILLDGEPFSHIWHDTRLGNNDPYPTDDTCFDFKIVGHARPMSYDVFGDADRNGRPEILGVYGGKTWIVEYSGHDTTYILSDSIYDALPIDYAKDSDGDGRLEYLATGIFNARAVLYEGNGPNVIPTDSIFYWPYGYIGGIFDVDGDGRIEVVLKSSHNRIQVWRTVGNNNYQFAYTITLPDSFYALFSRFVYGDFDNDGRNELIACSDIGIILGFEYTDADSFALVWVGQVSHYNANVIVGPTDMDGDGHKEFIVMANSIAMGGFFYYFFESTGDNLFTQVAIDSIPGDPWQDGGEALWDFDKDGTDELAVCYVDGIGLFKSFGDNTIQLIYQKQGLLGLSVFVYDTNENGWGEMVLDAGTNWGTVIREYVPGKVIFADINCDCHVNLVDLTYLVNYFKGYHLLPQNADVADVNGDCQVNGIDVTYFVNYFQGGPALIRCG